METTINERFIESVNYLIKVRSVKNKTELAQNLKIGRTALSEILNKRMNVGIETVAHYCLLYEIRLEWLLNNKGKMVRAGEFIPKTPDLYSLYLENIHTEENTKLSNHSELVETQKEVIELQKFKISSLEREITELKKAKEPTFYPRKVAESREKLKK